jgi:hypothetical protein
MNHLPWKGMVRPRWCGGMKDANQRTLMKWKPACEALDSRQLLSTVAATPVALTGPSATDVANAAATLESLAPTAFAQFQSDLAQAESHSHVTQAEVNKLAQNEVLIDQAIATSGLDPSTVADTVGAVQFAIDQAFLAGAYWRLAGSMIASLPRDRVQVIDGGLALVTSGSQRHGSRLAISRAVVRQTVHEMQAVARAVPISTRLSRAISDDFVGSGAIDHELNTRNDSVLNYDLEQVQVYYAGQIPNFVH